MKKTDSVPDYYKYEVGDKTILVVKIGEGFIRIGAKIKREAIFYDYKGVIHARGKSEFNRMFKKVTI